MQICCYLFAQAKELIIIIASEDAKKHNETCRMTRPARTSSISQNFQVGFLKGNPYADIADKLLVSI